MSPRRTRSSTGSSRSVLDSRAMRLPRRVTTSVAPCSTRSRCSLNRSCSSRTPTSYSSACSVINHIVAATSGMPDHRSSATATREQGERRRRSIHTDAARSLRPGSALSGLRGRWSVASVVRWVPAREPRLAFADGQQRTRRQVERVRRSDRAAAGFSLRATSIAMPLSGYAAERLSRKRLPRACGAIP